MKSPEGKRLNGRTCSVVKVTKSHIEVTISDGGRNGVLSFVEKDGTMKKFILKPENLSPKTSFSGFSFDKDCRETEKNIPQGNAFSFEVDTKKILFLLILFPLMALSKDREKFVQCPK
jgi:hypothetical protein